MLQTTCPCVVSPDLYVFVWFGWFGSFVLLVFRFFDTTTVAVASAGANAEISAPSASSAATQAVRAMRSEESIRADMIVCQGVIDEYSGFKGFKDAEVRVWRGGGGRCRWARCDVTLVCRAPIRPLLLARKRSWPVWKTSWQRCSKLRLRLRWSRVMGYGNLVVCSEQTLSSIKFHSVTSAPPCATHESLHHAEWDGRRTIRIQQLDAVCYVEKNTAARSSSSSLDLFASTSSVRPNTSKSVRVGSCCLKPQQ